jgi:hypothetical protein
MFERDGMKRGRRCVAVMLLCFAVMLGTSRLAAAQLYSAQGTWMTDSGSASGTWQGTIDAAGSDLSGDLTLTGIPDLTDARIDGTWHPGVIDTAKVYADSEVATISGIIADPSVSGTFTMPVGGGVTGTWEGQITMIPDDSTPTPVVDDPAADNTPNPDELTAEELAVVPPEVLAALASSIQQSAQVDAATPPPDAPDATPTPAPPPTDTPTPPS